MKKLNLTDKRKFKPWIYKIVTNTSLEILKNNKNYAQLENKKKYIIIRQHNNFQILYSSGYEAEIFEFMVKKLNCIPQESINK